MKRGEEKVREGKRGEEQMVREVKKGEERGRFLLFKFRFDC